MKKIFILLAVVISFMHNTSANFSWYSQVWVSWAVFDKVHGSNILWVYEEYPLNPFLTSTIKEETTICTWNNCPCGSSGCSYVSRYTVDGTTFNSSHSKYKNTSQIHKWWSQESPWIETMIEYLQPTHTTNNARPYPRQSVQVRKYYKVNVNFDTTPPTCHNVQYYQNSDRSWAFTYSPGTWMKKPAFYSMQCTDLQTWCYCDPATGCQEIAGVVYSKTFSLWHRVRPSASFTNKVNLSDHSCTPGWSFPDILFDLKTPSVSLSLGWEDFGLHLEPRRDYDIIGSKKTNGEEIYWNLTYTLSGGIDFLAWKTRLDIEVSDIFSSGSLYGVAWIKDYNLKVFRKSNRSFTPIASTELWSCSMNWSSWTPYNPFGLLETSDIKTSSINCTELLQSWNYQIEILVHDWANWMTKIKIPLRIYPKNTIDTSRSTLVVDSNDNKYANDRDVYTYTLTLKDEFWNPLFDRKIDSIAQNIISFTGGKEVEFPDWSTGLKLKILNSSNTTNLDGELRFTLSSYIPWEYTQRFKLDYIWWGIDYIQNKSPENQFFLIVDDNKFLHPFSANLSIDGTITQPEVGTDQKYRLELFNDGAVTGLSNGGLTLNTTTITFASPHTFDNFVATDNYFNLTDLVCKFDGKINATNEGWVLQAPEVVWKNVPISYRLWWRNVRYPLEDFSITWCGKDTLGLKVIWGIQGKGKSDITWQKDNFSDLSASVLRLQIRKNAYALIRWMQSWDVLNSVKYVKGDITISGNPTYETLIVEDGNVYINSDLNLAENNFGIIVLKSNWYKTESDYQNLWNIYINNNVENIYAYMYADGALRSAKSNGASYTTEELTKKLYLKWAIFTRNTVGGAVSAWSQFVLPWGTRTNNQNLAQIYDINYVRRSIACWTDYSFLVEYNPQIQINPPKGFSIQ